ncbi:menaquinone biosynthetic enzyme MqnA/MqnD family protein [Tumebacillus permanentifrigoris]|uniref:Chorismate dehydratase n=1 Tax=Tumebacillus permanentifrigoris TaxID=378543 RepID=A0A316D3W0_9BACL|nr:menaquinone biosynthesis protein [Tumebacillus permanentifrigoris]PWK06636.1 futalosine synthase [Tumebacillus permanentifrigoris]
MSKLSAGHRSGQSDTQVSTEHAKLRIGQIKFTNALPICHFIDRSDPMHEFWPGAPSELNSWLADGTIDAGLVSAFAYAQLADDFVALRGLSVSSRGPVGSIFLFSKRPIEELSGCTVALTSHSASSTNLARILLGEIGVRDVNYVTQEPDLPSMLDGAEAAVLIADHALHWSVQDHGLQMYDLGEEWHTRTGHSMTFAVCAVPRRLVEQDPEKARGIHRLFLEGKRKGLGDLEAVIAEATRMMGQTEDFWRSYFSKLIYDLHEELAVGADAYFDAAYRHGLLTKPVKLELWGDES